MLIKKILNIFSSLNGKENASFKDKNSEELFEKIKEIDYSNYFEFSPSKIIDEYWLNVPFSKAVIHESEKDIVYSLLEPRISREEFFILEKIHREIRDKIILKGEELKDKEKFLFRQFILSIKKFNGISLEFVGKLWYHIYKNFIGYEGIDSLLKDHYIEDISCNGYNLPVYVFHKAYGSIPTDITYSEEELDHFVLKLSQKANSQVSLERPLVDAALPSGERIQLTYRNVVSTKGSSFTIRKFSDEPITPLDLISWNTLNAEIMAFLWLAVENRMNMLIIGGTASGKTTMMNSISFFIPYNSKIVSLEDTREIQLPHKNWLPMVTRDGIDLFDLLKAALRQRPEYILVGEIRGREAITLFQAMNTGHITYSTLHAGSIESAINRLIHEPINVPIAMFDSLDMVITLSLQQRKGVAVRRMLALHEISLSGEKIKFKPIFRWDKQKDCFTAEKSDIFKKIEEGMDVDVEQEIRRRSDFLRKLAERRALKMHEIVKELNNYT